MLCHCEPARTLVWYPKGVSFGHNPPDFQTSCQQNQAVSIQPGGCHTTVTAVTYIAQPAKPALSAE